MRSQIRGLSKLIKIGLGKKADDRICRSKLYVITIASARASVIPLARGRRHRLRHHKSHFTGFYLQQKSLFTRWPLIETTEFLRFSLPPPAPPQLGLFRSLVSFGSSEKQHESQSCSSDKHVKIPLHLFLDSIPSDFLAGNNNHEFFSHDSTVASITFSGFTESS